MLKVRTVCQLSQHAAPCAGLAVWRIVWHSSAGRLYELNLGKRSRHCDPYIRRAAVSLAAILKRDRCALLYCE